MRDLLRAFVVALVVPAVMTAASPVDTARESSVDRLLAAAGREVTEDLFDFVLEQPGLMIDLKIYLVERLQAGTASETETERYENALNLIGRVEAFHFEHHLDPLREKTIAEGYRALAGFDLDAGIRSWQEGLESARQSGDRVYQARFLDLLARSAADRGDWEGELRFHHEALPILAAYTAFDEMRIVLERMSQIQIEQHQFAAARTPLRALLDLGTRAKEPELELEALVNLAVIETHLESYDEAIRLGDRAILLAEELGDLGAKGKALGNLGWVLRNRGETARSIEVLTEALELQRLAGDSFGVACDLSNLAIAHRDLGNFRQALAFQKEAHEIHLRLEEPGDIARSLGYLGLIYGSTGERQKAQQHWLQALEMSRQSGHQGVIHECLYQLGTLARELDSPAEALAYLEEALELGRTLGTLLLEAETLEEIGLAHSDLGEHEQGLEFVRQAIDKARASGVQIDEVGYVISRGNLEQRRGSMDAALRDFEAALALSRSIGNQNIQIWALEALGSFWVHRDQRAQALVFLEEALQISRTVGMHQLHVSLLASTGLAYDGLGAYQQAKSHLTEGLQLAEARGQASMAVGIRMNLGLLYKHMGREKEARLYLEQALADAERLQLVANQASIHNNLGGLHYESRQFARARDHFERAVELSRSGKDPAAVAEAMGNLAMAKMFTGDAEKGWEVFLEAVAAYDELGDREGLALSLTNTAGLMATTGLLEPAAKLYERALSEFRDVLSAGQAWRFHAMLGAIHGRMGQTPIAIANLQRASALLEQSRATIGETHDRVAFLEANYEVNEHFIRVLADAHMAQPDERYEAMSFETFEHLQGRALLDEIGRSGLRQMSGAPAERVQQEERLQRRMIDLRARLASENLRSLDQRDWQQIEALESELAGLEQEEQKLQALEADDPKYRALRYPSPAPAEILKKILAEDEALVAYLVLREKTVVWVLTRQSLELHLVDLGRSEIDERVTELRRLLRVPVGEMRGVLPLAEKGLDAAIDRGAHRLYEALFPPAVRHLTRAARTLYVVPSGPLYYLPFEVLVTAPGTNAGPRRYLIEDKEISYVSSASLLRSLRQVQAEKQSYGRHPLLAFADPVYAGDGQAAADTGIRGLRRSVYRSLAGELTELPDTALEARAIAGILGASPASDPLRLRERASRDAVLELNRIGQLKDYRFLLFAAHGLVPGNVSQLQEPALVLSPGPSGRYLTMSDVLELDINAELVVLSACNTGLGEQRRGEGVLGFTRAFLLAGAQAVAVTLWPVESRSSRLLTTGLFREIRDGRPPAEALRRAKLRLLRGEDGAIYRHPSFWASFVIFGNSRR